VLQGGGALGAFEAGVVKALESENIFPDIVAGVSIGALNGAIIAANPRHATEALESFWRELTVIPPPLPFENLRRAAVARPDPDVRGSKFLQASVDAAVGWRVRVLDELL
jgi:NTE family protein